MHILTHFTRIWAGVTMLALTVWATSRIGTQPSCEPVTWDAAWVFLIVVSVNAAVFFLAGRESKENQ